MIRIPANAAEKYVVRREVVTVKLESAVPRHERIVFVPQTERGSQLGRDAKTVTNVPSELPFPSRSLDELLAPAHPIRQPQQELRPCVELVGCRASVERRHAASKVKLSSRPGAKFRLPVVQVVMDDVRSGADLVLAMGPSNVVVADEAPVVPVSGIPSLGVAEIGVARDGEERYTAASQVVRIVGTRNPEHAQSNVCAKVRCLPVLAHTSKADIAVDDQSGRQGQSVTHGDELHKIMKVAKPAVTITVANGLAQTGLTVKHRLHGAVFGEDSVLGSAIPVHLAVKVVAVQALCG